MSAPARRSASLDMNVQPKVDNETTTSLGIVNLKSATSVFQFVATILRLRSLLLSRFVQCSQVLFLKAKSFSASEKRINLKKAQYFFRYSSTGTDSHLTALE
jgi:hypothetical protein